MALRYPSEWKFAGPAEIPALPAVLAGEFFGLLTDIASSAEDEWSEIERFKRKFGATHQSSDSGWAETDLSSAMQSRAENSVNFIDSLWVALEDAQGRGLKTPSTKQVNARLLEHGVPFQIQDGEIQRVHADAAISVAPVEGSPDSSHAHGIVRQERSSDGQSVEVPSKNPDEVMPWDQAGWRALFDEKERLDGDRGGYGIVVRVVERTSCSEFALKFLKSNDAESRARFKREIIQQGGLRGHGHVVRVEAHDETFDWYTMPVAEGSLSEFGAELSDDEIGEVILQIASALGEAHRKDIIHRDVKPANILLDADLPGDPRNWRIGDFGAARAPRGQTRTLKTTKAIGTRGFIAPEVLIAPHLATAAADVYGLGCTLAWLTTGILPEEYKPPVGGGLWRELVEEMTEFEMTARLQTMDDVRVGVWKVIRAARIERRATWGKVEPSKAQPEALGSRADRVLWSIVNDAPSDLELPELPPRAIAPDEMAPAEVRVTLSSLVARGYLTRELVGDDRPVTVYRLTATAVRYVEENVDRLTVAFRDKGDERPDDDIPF